MTTIGSFSKWFYTLVLLPVTLALCAWQSWAWWHWAISPVTSETTKASPSILQIDIPQGTTTLQIGKDLEAAGAINSAFAWNLWSLWLNWQDSQRSFQAGTYQISTTQSTLMIADIIRKGEVRELTFTIPEGRSLKEMAEYFESRGYFPKADFLKAAAEMAKTSKYNWLPPKLTNLEGFLFPDTYQLPNKDIQPEEVIKMMLERFEKKVLPVYNSAKVKPIVNGKPISLQQWLTLASLVEKEAQIPEERELIAGVFFNRLQRGTKLESDPTVEYGLGIRQTPDRPLTFAQVRTPNPYNTYVNPGLPPGPIASSGLASLKAALNPQKTDFIFFVARYDGSHAFSRTEAEHERAKQAIRKQREARRQSEERRKQLESESVKKPPN